VEQVRQTAVQNAYATFVAANQTPAAGATYASAVASAYATAAATITSSLAQLSSDHDNALATLRTSLGVLTGGESVLS
jgi:hypothetical protein